MLHAVLNKSWKQYPAIHKRRSFMDPYTWTRQCWPTCKNLYQLHADTGCLWRTHWEWYMIEMDRERESGIPVTSARLDDDDDDDDDDDIDAYAQND